MTIATQTALGTVKLAGALGGNNNGNAPELPASGATAGTYSNPNVTVSSTGIITSISTGTPIDLFSVPLATTTTPGVASIGTGLTVSSGVVSAVVATSSVLGVASIGTGLTVSSGAISVDTAMYPTLANGGTYTGAVITNVSTLNITGSTTLNFQNSNVFDATLTGNVTMNVPSNLSSGGVYFIVLRQDATGSRTCTFNSAFKFESGSPATLSTAANAIDLLRVVVVSGTVLVSKLYKAFS